MEKLGGQINAVDRAAIEDTFFRKCAEGYSEYDASIAALTEYHKSIFHEANELRRSVNAPLLRYRYPRTGKSFDYDGLTLAREPNETEKLIDLKSIAGDLESEKEKCVTVLTRFRKDLISQAVEKIDKLTPETAHTLSLTPDPDKRKQVRSALASAYRKGRQQIIAELAAQRAAKNLSPIETKRDEDLDDELLDEWADGIISKMIGEVQGRAINLYTTLRLLLDYTVDKLKEKLLDESAKWLEQLAGNAVNASMRTGRDAEIDANIDEIGHCEYSAILDSSVCDVCAEADGMTGPTPDDLPDAPNPECAGGANCRCMIVAVIV
jgi:hypothetical protein